jgi:hypothetical protein
VEHAELLLPQKTHYWELSDAAAVAAAGKYSLMHCCHDDVNSQQTVLLWMFPEEGALARMVVAASSLLGIHGQK